MKDYFARSVVGQEAVRKKLSYYVEVYYKTNIFRNCLFLASKGGGKTLLARTVGEKLGKRFVEVNAASIGKFDDFLDDIFIPFCMSQPVTLFIDEIHALNKKVEDFLLSVLAPNASNRNIVRFRGGTTIIDFRLFTFLSASTEPQKIFPALKNRLENIIFGRYSRSELMQILTIGAGHIDIDPQALDFFMDRCKYNARFVAELGKEVQNFALVKNVKEINLSMAKELIGLLGLYESGLSKLELEILESLSQSPASSLTRLAAKHGLTPSAARNLELELLAHDLIEINNGRRLTMPGRQYLERNLKK